MRPNWSRRATHLLRWWFLQIMGRKLPLETIFHLRRFKTDCPRHSDPLAGLDLGDCPDELEFDIAAERLRQHYEQGARFVTFESDADLWSSRDKSIADLVDEARRLGYFRVSCAISGTKPFSADADRIEVRVDGPPPIHDALHGDGAFERLGGVLENVGPDRTALARVTVSPLNIRVFEDAVHSAEQLPAVRSVTFEFASASQADEPLGDTQRAIIASLAMQLRSRGSAIAVPSAVLRRLARLERIVHCPAWLSLHVLPSGAVGEGCPASAAGGECRSCASLCGVRNQLLIRGDLSLLLELAWRRIRS